VARKYPFYPAWDGKKASPVTVKLVELMGKRYKFTNLGVYVNRQMRGSNNLSVHATGFAADVGYPNTKEGRANAVEAWDWLIKYSEELRICEVHDYSFRNPKQSDKDKTSWGRGYRCSRGIGLKGVKLFTSKDNAGTPNGKWLHIEVSNDWESAEAFEAAWRSLPKPGA
jgi:hypothetical protein